MWMGGVYNTDDQIIEAFIAHDGNVSRASQELGISTQSLYRRIASNKRLSEALNLIRKGTELSPCPKCHGSGTVPRNQL